jgi:hypothetical protein
MTLINGTQANRTVLGFRERVAIMDHLHDKLTKLPGGYCAYVDPHNDRTTAEAMAFPCSEKNVAGIRVKMFGRLRDPHPIGLTTRVEILEKAVEDLYARMGETPPLL